MGWRTVLAWDIEPERRGQGRDYQARALDYMQRYRREDPTVKLFTVYYNGQVSAVANVAAPSFDEAYELATAGYDADFEVNEPGDSWDIYLLRDNATDEEQEYG